MRKGVASFSGLAVIVISVLGGARPAPAQQPTGQVVRLGEGETLTIGGFINGTLFNDVGPFNGVPPFGDEQPQFRVRHAFVDLSNGRTTLRIGQYWAPLFGETAAFIPVSVTHIAFPVGLGASMIGWRFPGVFLFHDLTPSTNPLKLQLEVAALKGSGPTAAGNARDSLSNIGSGEASGLPQVETRVNAARRFKNVSWNGFVVYHI